MTTSESSPFRWEHSVRINIPAAIPWYILAVATILTNGLVLLSFAKEKRLRTYINYYVINLALADFSVGIVIIPTYSVIVMLGWYWPFFGFYGCKIFQGVSYALVTVSILSVIAIAIDRFYATVSPIHYFSYRRKRNAVRINILCWIIAFSIWIPFNTLWPIMSKKIPRVETFCGPDYGQTLVTTLVAICILFWFPVILLIVLNLRVYYEIIKSGQLSVSKSFGDGQTTDADMSSASQQVSTSQTEASVVYSLSVSGHQNPGYIADDSDDTCNEKNLADDIDDILFKVPDDSVHVGQNKRDNEVLGNSPVVIERNDDTKNDGSDDHSEARCDYRRQLSSRQVVRVPSSPFYIARPEDVSSISHVGSRKVHDGKRATRKRESVKESVKAFRILSVVVLSYIFSWVMFGAMIVIIAVCIEVTGKKCTSSREDLISQYLSLCNSLINPICYAAVQPLFKKTIMRMFTK
ncbi:Muscarinic acetylcholine receptor M1 [Holothuria leucospilota]|uniref:Muscarinic acetylcholine receptor M1 n=1 Tax=Holothuria leucospilota TaxID=206669 RepID=A0A9Q1BTS3_HOLLE|nr:Muscarinic acetylcholine receptor M1 [Holothuria leucospilota]